MSGKAICFNSSEHYTSGLIGVQSNPINPGWGRKGSAGAGRTSSSGAQDGQQGSFPGWQVALGTAGEQAKPCQCPPPSLPDTRGALSTPRSNVPHPLCLEGGFGCQRSAQHSAPWAVTVCLSSIQSSFSGLGDSRGDYKVHAQQRKAMISS